MNSEKVFFGVVITSTAQWKKIEKKIAPMSITFSKIPIFAFDMLENGK
jgi:hypothetical protein